MELLILSLPCALVKQVSLEPNAILLVQEQIATETGIVIQMELKDFAVAIQAITVLLVHCLVHQIAMGMVLVN